MYWEDYDGQDAKDFQFVEYNSIMGKTVRVPVESDLDDQVAEIRRCNGSATRIRVLREN